MKLINIIIEKSLATSKAFKNAVSSTKDIALQIQELALGIATLAKIIHIHEMKINNLYDHVVKSSKDNSVDISFSPKKDEKIEKPN